MDSNIDDIGIAGRVTRARRKRLGSESEESSRQNTPVAVQLKMEPIPEQTPTKRLTRRNSITVTPKTTPQTKTPSKKPATKETEKTPKRLTRRSSVSSTLVNRGNQLGDLLEDVATTEGKHEEAPTANDEEASLKHIVDVKIEAENESTVIDDTSSDSKTVTFEENERPKSSRVAYKKTPAVIKKKAIFNAFNAQFPKRNFFQNLDDSVVLIEDKLSPQKNVSQHLDETSNQDTIVSITEEDSVIIISPSSEKSLRSGKFVSELSPSKEILSGSLKETSQSIETETKPSEMDEENSDKGTNECNSSPLKLTSNIENTTESHEIQSSNDEKKIESPKKSKITITENERKINDTIISIIDNSENIEHLPQNSEQQPEPENSKVETGMQSFSENCPELSFLTPKKILDENAGKVTALENSSSSQDTVLADSIASTLSMPDSINTIRTPVRQVSGVQIKRLSLQNKNIVVVNDGEKISIGKASKMPMAATTSPPLKENIMPSALSNVSLLEVKQRLSFKENDNISNASSELPNNAELFSEENNLPPMMNKKTSTAIALTSMNISNSSEAEASKEDKESKSPIESVQLSAKEQQDSLCSEVTSRALTEYESNVLMGKESLSVEDSVLPSNLKVNDFEIETEENKSQDTIINMADLKQNTESNTNVGSDILKQIPLMITATAFSSSLENDSGAFDSSNVSKTRVEENERHSAEQSVAEDSTATNNNNLHENDKNKLLSLNCEKEHTELLQENFRKELLQSSVENSFSGQLDEKNDSMVSSTNCLHETPDKVEKISEQSDEAFTTEQPTVNYEKRNSFAKSWNQSVHSKSEKIDPIAADSDQMSTNDLSSKPSVKETQSNANKFDESSSDYEMNVETEEDEEEEVDCGDKNCDDEIDDEKNEFLDNQATDAGVDYESGDSMNSEEREMYADNMIAEECGGESIGSEDTTQDEDESLDENDSFIASSDEESAGSAAFSDDDELTEEQQKKYKRIVFLESDNEEENIDYSDEHLSKNEANKPVNAADASDENDVNLSVSCKAKPKLIEERQILRDDAQENYIEEPSSTSFENEKVKTVEETTNTSTTNEEKSTSMPSSSVRQSLEVSSTAIEPSDEQELIEATEKAEENKVDSSSENKSTIENKLDDVTEATSVEIIGLKPDGGLTLHLTTESMDEAAFQPQRHSFYQSHEPNADISQSSSDNVKQCERNINSKKRKLSQSFPGESQKSKKTKHNASLDVNMHSVSSMVTSNNIFERKSNQQNIIIEPQNKKPETFENGFPEDKNKDEQETNSAVTSEEHAGAIKRALQASEKILSLLPNQSRVKSRRLFSQEDNSKINTRGNYAKTEMQAEKAKRKSAIERALRAAHAILEIEPPKTITLSKKPEKSSSLPSPPPRHSKIFESKKLSSSFLEALKPQSVPCKRKRENYQDTKVFETKTGLVVETKLSSPLPKVKNPVEVLKMKTGNVYVELASPKRSRSGFVEGPASPVNPGWKVDVMGKKRHHWMENKVGVFKVEKIPAVNLNSGYQGLASDPTERARSFLRSALSNDGSQREEARNILRRKKFVH